MPRPRLHRALAADIAEFDTVGTTITYTATVTNTGNEADAPDVRGRAGRRPDLHPRRRPLAPGASTTCTGTLTTTTGADVVRTATVTWGAQSATSDPVTVTWVAASPSPSPSGSPTPSATVEETSPAPNPTTDAAPTVVDGLADTGAPGLGAVLLGVVLLALGVLLTAVTTRTRSPRHTRAH